MAGLAHVRAQITPDVAAGEYSWTLADSARLLDAGPVGYLIDATRCGSVTGFLRAAALAEAHSSQVSGHCATSAHANVSAATPNLRHLEYFHDHQRIEALFFDGMPGSAGGVLTPHLTSPGLGVAFRARDTARYRTAQWA